MAVDGRLWVDTLECGDNGAKRHALGVRSGITCLTVRVGPTDVADADTPSIVTVGVSAYLGERPSEVYRAVKLDDNVVSYVSPSSVEVPLADGLGLDIAALWGGATVYDYSLHVAC